MQPLGEADRKQGKGFRRQAVESLPLLGQDKFAVRGDAKAIVCPIVNDDRLAPPTKKLGKLDPERRLAAEGARGIRLSPIGALRCHY